jgi:hypothetical protein
MFKAAIMARCSDSLKWLDDLPLVMLGLRAAYKEDLKCSAAEVVFGEPLRLPGACLGSTADDASGAESVVEDYVSELAKAASSRSYCAVNWHGNDNAPGQQDAALKTCSHVYIRVDAVKKPLQRPYQGPFSVLERGDKCFVLQRPDGGTDTVSIDRLKPAFGAADVEREPPEDTTTRSGRPVRLPLRYRRAIRYSEIGSVAWANIPRSDAERYILEISANEPMPMLDPQHTFEDDVIYDGPPLSLSPDAEEKSHRAHVEEKPRQGNKSSCARK